MSKFASYSRLVSLTEKDTSGDEFAFLSETLESTGIMKVLAEKKAKEKEQQAEELAELIIDLSKNVHGHLIQSRDAVRAARLKIADNLQVMHELALLYDYSVSNMDFTSIVAYMSAITLDTNSTRRLQLLQSLTKDIPADYRKAFEEKEKKKKMVAAGATKKKA